MRGHAQGSQRWPGCCLTSGWRWAAWACRLISLLRPSSTWRGPVLSGDLEPPCRCPLAAGGHDSAVPKCQWNLWCGVRPGRAPCSRCCLCASDRAVFSMSRALAAPAPGPPGVPGLPEARPLRDEQLGRPAAPQACPAECLGGWAAWGSRPHIKPACSHHALVHIPACGDSKCGAASPSTALYPPPPPPPGAPFPQGPRVGQPRGSGCRAAGDCMQGCTSLATRRSAGLAEAVSRGYSHGQQWALLPESRGQEGPCLADSLCTGPSGIPLPQPQHRSHCTWPGRGLGVSLLRLGHRNQVCSLIVTRKALRDRVEFLVLSSRRPEDLFPESTSSPTSAPEAAPPCGAGRLLILHNLTDSSN